MIDDDDDFYLDDDEMDGDAIFYESEDSSEKDDSDEETFEGESQEREEKGDSSRYEGKLTENEVYMQTLYEEIISKLTDIDSCVMSIVGVDPKNTSDKTIMEISKEILNLQGHNRIRATSVNPNKMIRGAELAEAFEADEDTSVNEEYRENLQKLITGFVGYLANRDLSQDSTVSRTRKQRLLPALIIYLFASGAYDFVLNCPTMPPVYDRMIKRALQGLKDEQDKILQELIQAYIDKGRPEVAERIKTEGSRWFDHEPAQILDLAGYRSLKLTKDDVAIYKQYRSRYTNSSHSITQEVISNYIEVQVDEKKGIYKPLKDKTRTEAINDVKKEFMEWSRENGTDYSEDLAKKLIYKHIEEE